MTMAARKIPVLTPQGHLLLAPADEARTLPAICRASRKRGARLSAMSGTWRCGWAALEPRAHPLCVLDEARGVALVASDDSKGQVVAAGHGLFQSAAAGKGGS